MNQKQFIFVPISADSAAPRADPAVHRVKQMILSPSYPHIHTLMDLFTAEGLLVTGYFFSVELSLNLKLSPKKTFV